MSSGEESKILSEIRELKSDFKIFVTKLMGDEDQENPEGRIPRLEAGQRNHERRIFRLEALVLMVFGAGALIKAIGWMAVTAHNLLSITQHVQR